MENETVNVGDKVKINGLIAEVEAIAKKHGEVFIVTVYGDFNISVCEKVGSEDQAEKWEKAEKHLTEYEETIKDLSSMAGCNINFLAGLVAGIRIRFDRGDRSESLYKDIMSLS